MIADANNSPKFLFTTAFVSSLMMLLIIPIQIMVFAMYPIPDTVQEWFSLFASSPIIGLFHSDLFLLVNNILIAIIYLALYETLKEKNASILQAAIALGFIGIAAYISSNKSFELLALAKEYADAVTEADRLMLLSAGKVMLVSWQGTAFDAYYVLNGIALLVLSISMFRSSVYSKLTASMGLAAAIFMTIPSTAGTLGLVFSLISLLPWYIFTIMYSRIFLKLSK